MENIEETLIGSVIGSDASPFQGLRREHMRQRTQDYGRASLDTAYQSLASDKNQRMVTRALMPVTKHIVDQFQTNERLWPYSPLGHLAREEDHPMVRLRKRLEEQYQEKEQAGVVSTGLQRIIPRRIEAVQECQSAGFLERVVMGFCFAHYLCTNQRSVEAIGKVVPEAFMIQYERDRETNPDTPGVFRTGNSTLHCGTKQVIDDLVGVMYDTAEQEGKIAFVGLNASIALGQGLKYASRSASSTVMKILLTGARGTAMGTGAVAVLATGAKIYDGLESLGLREPLEPHVQHHMEEVGERMEPVCSAILDDALGDLGTRE